MRTGTTRSRAALALAMLLSLAPTRGDAELLDALTGLYGGDGITLDTSGSANATAFEASVISELAGLRRTLRNEFVPFVPVAPAGSLTFDLENGEQVRGQDSLGPLVAERPHTVGRNRLDFGFSITSLNFDTLAGKDLDTTRLSFASFDLCLSGSMPPCPPGEGPSPGMPSFERETLSATLDLEIEQDILQVFANYGITDRWEIGVLVPFVRTRFHVGSQATLDFTNNLNGPQQFWCFDRSNAAVNAGANNCQVGEDRDISTGRSSEGWGIGDVVARTKFQFLEAGERAADLAVLSQVKFHSGNEKEFRGSGDMAFSTFLIASREFEGFTPHLNLGLDVSTRSTDHFALRYIAGFEVSPHERTTLGLDVIGRHDLERDGFADDLVDIAVGGKLRALRNLILFLNFTTPLNRDTGLRSKITYTIGFEYVL